MVQKNAGFTLVELLGVITILAILVIVASTGALNIVNKAREKTAEEIRENLKQSAITYALEEEHLKKCEEDFSKNVYEQDNVSNKDSAVSKGCAKEIRVKDLKDKGFFEDKKNSCNDSDTVLVYYYSVNGNSEYKAYVDGNLCKN